MGYIAMQGYVMGFSGSRLYCLHDAALHTVEAPLPAALQCYLQRQDVESAYQVNHQALLQCPVKVVVCPQGFFNLQCCMQVACLGVRESDWQALARAAIQGLRHPEAEAVAGRKHLNDMHMRDVVRRLGQQGAAGLPHAVALADALAALVCATSTIGQKTCVLTNHVLACAG